LNNIITDETQYIQFEDGVFGSDYHGDEISVADGAHVGGVDLTDHLLHLSSSSPDDVSAECQSLGGYLALISDDQEKAAVQGFLASYPSPPYYSIDGTDAATEDVWVTEAGDVIILIIYLKILKKYRI